MYYELKSWVYYCETTMILSILLIELGILVALVEGQASVCTQNVLDRSFMTQCGPKICEPVLEKDRGGKRPNEWPTTRDEVVHVISSRAGDRFKVNTYPALDRGDIFYEESHPNGTIFVEPDVKYQRILGFGTTMTDASCKNVDDLPDNLRGKLISDYFNPDEGIGLNLIKVPIGSDKYSFSNYVLDEPDTERVELSPYDIDFRIPIIKDAIKAAGRLKNRVKILASSASAPPAYKLNNKMIDGGSLRQNKFNEYASYLNGFVATYMTNELNVWALILSDSPVTIANARRDGNLTLDYNSMTLSPADTIKLIEAINKVRLKQPESGKYRLLLLGDNRAHIPVWTDAIFRRPEVANYVAGVAYTCKNDKAAPYDSLVYSTKRYPNKYLLATQGSSHSTISLANWQYAENYGTEMVKNLEFGSVGWIDFNMALNLEGGPSINEQYKADTSVMIDSRRQTYYRNPTFYAIGHLSRYIKPGSVRVKINFYSSPHMFASQQIAFVTPDNYLVVFIMNNNIGPMPVNIGIKKRTKVEQLLDTKSFNTFIFRL